jgi:hypothetical protein
MSCTTLIMDKTLLLVLIRKLVVSGGEVEGI